VSLVKANVRFSNVLMAFLMTLVLDTVITFTMVSVQVGWTSVFPIAFIVGWFTGFAVGLPTSLLAMPLIMNVVKKLTTENP
jgi:hypothetical protein